MLLKNIRNLCAENGITISELERNLEFGNGTIHKWGKAQPSVDKVLKIAQYFNIGIDSLFEPEFQLPSIEARQVALTYDALSEEQKKLLKCYLSIIQKEGKN